MLIKGLSQFNESEVLDRLSSKESIDATYGEYNGEGYEGSSRDEHIIIKLEERF